MEALHLSSGTGPTNASQPRGLWSNGTTMFVTDSEDEKVYAFKHSDESQDTAKNIPLRSAQLRRPRALVRRPRPLGG